jgi:tRNA(Ile)-lysidine synthase
MAALVETSDLRLLRPLLRIPPDRLRRTLTQHAISWIEDPSNSDQRAQRARIRNELSGSTDGLAARLLSVAALSGADRMARRRAEAEVLAARAVLRPEGFAYLPPELLPAGPMAALLQTMGGGRYRPSPSSVDRLIRRPIPATLAGIRVMPAGRIGPGWLLVREAAAIGNPVQATDGTIWDGRFRLDASGHPPPLPRDACVDALGGDQAAMRPLTTLPSAVLSSLPVLRHQGRLCAVPHLRWAAGPVWAGFRFAFASAVPASDQALFTPT